MLCLSNWVIVTIFVDSTKGFCGFVTKENVKFVLFAHPVHQYSSDHMFLDSIISIHLYVVFILKREILPWKTSWP